MALTLGHFSDLHGRPQVLLHAYQHNPPPDLWVNTGDFFPNETRGNVKREQKFQREWFTMPRPFLAGRSLRFWLCDQLKGVPLLSLDGNHDFVSLADLMSEVGYPVHRVTTHGILLHNKVFAGFRHIPYIAGEWMGEAATGALCDLTKETFQCNSGMGPDILVTHAPPAGIMDGTESHHFGVNAITNHLAYKPHKVTHHLFGHVHESRGTHTEMDVKFVNSATILQFITI